MPHGYRVEPLAPAPSRKGRGRFFSKAETGECGSLVARDQSSCGINVPVEDPPSTDRVCPFT